MGNYRILLVVLILTLFPLFSCTRYLTSRERVEVLRNQGFKHLMKKEFEESSDYYVAALAMSQQDSERFVNDRALYNYGLLFSTWERYASAIERLEDRLHANRGNRLREIFTLNGLGEIYIDLGKHSRALEYFSRSLALAEREGNRQGQCSVLTFIGNTLLALKNDDSAFDHFFRSRDIAQNDKLAECLSESYLGLGRVWEKRKKKEQLKASYTLALTTSREAGYSEGEEKALEALGKFFMKENDNRRALSYFIPALELKQDVIDQRGSAHIWHLIGDAYLQWGQNLSAQRAYAEAFRIRFDIKTFYECSVLLRKLGRVYRKMGKVKEALHYYTRSRMFFRTLGYLTGESRTLLEIAQLYSDQKNFTKARDQARRGLKITIDTEDRPGERGIRRFLAKLYRENGRIETAIKEMQKVVAIDEEIKSDHTIEDARFIKELVDSL